MESLWLLPLFGFIFFIVIGQVFKFYVSFDFLENSGLVVIKLWFFKLKQFSVQFKKDGIVIRTGKQVEEVKYAFNDPKLKFVQDFSKEVMEKTKVKLVDIYSNVGAGDAQGSALLSSSVNVLWKILMAKIKNTKPTCTVDITNQTFFNDKVFNVSVFSKVSLSIFDALYSLIFAWLKSSNNT